MKSARKISQIPKVCVNAQTPPKCKSAAVGMHKTVFASLSDVKNKAREDKNREKFHLANVKIYIRNAINAQRDLLR